MSTKAEVLQSTQVNGIEVEVEQLTRDEPGPRRGWLRGTFEDSNVVYVQIDATRECATNDGSGVKVSYVRGTEPAPCKAD